LKNAQEEANAKDGLRHTHLSGFGGVPIDEQKAMHYFELSAKQGYTAGINDYTVSLIQAGREK
jgi:TPR repeat protein